MRQVTSIQNSLPDETVFDVYMWFGFGMPESFRKRTYSYDQRWITQEVTNWGDYNGDGKADIILSSGGIGDVGFFYSGNNQTVACLA